MPRFVFFVPFVLLVSAATAQTGKPDACTRDVARFCRATMNDGDMAVLACLKQNRSRLSKGCENVLIEHGQ